MKKMILETLSKSRSWTAVAPGRILLMALAISAFSTQAQISVFIQQPESSSGALEFTWSNTWGANLNDIPYITGILEMVDDGTAADSLGCETLVNDAEMAGKIALVYRGTCEFGMKAYNAQNAGAIAVVIVNNVPGGPVGMGAGAMGAQVTIPVVMVSDQNGAMLRDLMEQGDVELLIGNLTGVFAYNLALVDSALLLPNVAAMPAQLAMDGEDLTISLGASIFNFGNMGQSNVRLQAIVTQDGTTVYNETSDPATVNVNQEVLFILPNFTQEPYEGHYEIRYIVLSDNDDEFPSNDEYVATLHIGDIFSYAPINPATEEPITGWHVIPADLAADGWRSCIYFKHPNASRVIVTGLWVNMSAAADSLFDGNNVVVEMLSWDEDVVDFEQVPAAGMVTQQAVGDHFLSIPERGQPVFVPFLEPAELLDDQSYLFCQTTVDNVTTHGHVSGLNYQRNMELNMYPVSLQNMNADGGWFGWTNVFNPPSIGVATEPVDIGIPEHSKIEITPFPNPTNDHIRIPVTGHTGMALLEIFDLAGAKVAERNVNVNSQEQIVVDMNGVSNGTYVFNMMFENGKRANFRVVVSR